MSDCFSYSKVLNDGRAKLQQLAGICLAPSSHACTCTNSLDRAKLQQLAGSGEYFLGLLPDGGAVIRTIKRGERLPMNLGRQILAALAGVPDRADWRACAKAGPAEEEAAAEAFKAMYKPYDIMQQ